tara:strand:- start:165950 stop:166405 length:456 start_codon:yes stop_codon:yes gene_type:complete
MLDKVKTFLGLGPTDENTKSLGLDSPLHMAATSLLVNISMSHDGFSDEERTTILETLQEHYKLSAEKALHILNRAISFEKNAIDLHSFTRVINDHLEQDGRQDIVRLLWKVAYADNHLDSAEANTISKIADLLGVSTRDRVQIKQEVESLK